MKRTADYFTEVKNELEKVSWPKREDAVKLTLTVVIITALVGAYVGMLDYGFARLLEYILSI